MESRPVLPCDDVTKTVADVYGLRVTKQTTLNSYDDVNVHVLVDDNHDNSNIENVAKGGYVLKVLNSADSKKIEFIGAMHGCISCVINAGIATPSPVPDKHGEMYSLHTFNTDRGQGEYLVRLFTYIPGEVLEDKPYTTQLCYQVGQLTARLDKALQDYQHPSLSGHTRHWNLREVHKLPNLLHCIHDDNRKQLVAHTAKQFTDNVLNQSSKLLKGVIHGDLNEGNIVVTPVPDASTTTYQVCGVLDFGDLVEELVVYDIAIAIAYMMIETKHDVGPIDAGGHVLAGYLSKFELPLADCNVLKECVCARLAQSVTYGAYTHHLDPTNTYCLRTSTVGWGLLEELLNMSKEELYGRWNRILNMYKLTQIKLL